MKVGFVMPVHNRRETTLRALRTLARAARTGLDLRIFVVDDGSTDGTSDAIRQRFPEVNLIHGDGTLHYAAGTNRGISAAMAWGADHVIAANDDSIFDVDSLRRLVACAESHPRSVVGALLLRWDQPHRAYQVGWRWLTSYGGWYAPTELTAFNVPRTPWEVQSIVGNCFLVPAEAIRRHGMLDERRFPHGWGDAQFTARLRRAGWRLLIEPRARVWCEPNTNPPSLLSVPVSAALRILLLDERHPMNLRRQLVARWHSAPSRAQAVAAFWIYSIRLGLKTAGLGGCWPARKPSRAPMAFSPLWLPIVRFYIRNSPIRRGKDRLGALARQLSGKPPASIVRSRDGRRFEADLANGMSDALFVAAEYEPAITRLVRAIVRPGDVCLDVGANFGWYTTLLSTLSGPAGAVHAFEPLPDVFAWLGRNVALLGSDANVHLVRAAVGDARCAEVPLFLADHQSSGHASLRAGKRAAQRVATAPLVTLGEYLAAHLLRPVDFVKVDVEGAERAVLEGAAPLFRQAAPPIWIIEMARETATPFGYHPNDLLVLMRRRAPYRFFAIDERSGRILEIDSFARRDIGANVLCVPSAREACLRGLKTRQRRPGDFSPDAYPGRFEDEPGSPGTA